MVPKKVLQIKIYKQDITTLDVECIVNAANDRLLPGAGVCGSIFRKAGYEDMENACRAIGHCDTGNAVITPGFNLKAKYVVHAVGPIWHGGKANEAELLYQCYQNSMAVAEEKGCRTIGFPVISSGIYGYPADKAWEVAMNAVSEYEGNIVPCFAVLDDEMLKLGKAAYEGLMFKYVYSMRKGKGEATEE